MPDLDRFDLDAAFTALEHDISSSSSPRGADVAISTARRRRRTTAGAAAAVAVLAVAGATGGAWLHHHNDVGPAGPPPPPAELTPAALSAATAGWIEGWAAPTHDSQLSDSGLANLSCLSARPVTKGLDSPSKRGSALFTTPAGQIGVLIGLEFAQTGSTSAAAAGELASAVAACHPTTSTSADYGTGVVATFNEIPGAQGHPDMQLWTVVDDDRVAFLAIGGVGDTPPDDTVTRVDDAMVSAVRSDASFTQQVGALSAGTATGSSSSSSGSSPSFAGVEEGALRQAFGSWPSGLTDGAAHEVPSTPCLTDPSGLEAPSSQGASIGANASENTFDFLSADAAAAGLTRLADGWKACSAASYAVTTVAVPGHGSVTVATVGGANAATNWAVQEGRFLTVVAVNGGSSPPDSVSAAIGALLYDELDNPLPEPSSSTLAPERQQSGPNAPTVSSSAASTAPKG